jgi:hypothetical protein
LTWSVAWAAIFALLAVVVGVVDPDSIDPGEGPLRVAGIGAVFGFLSGAGFGLLLSMAEGRKMLRGLSVWRAALWGALGTAAFPLLTSVDNRMLYLVCPIGAALAASWVAIAKRGAPRDEPMGL